MSRSNRSSEDAGGAGRWGWPKRSGRFACQLERQPRGRQRTWGREQQRLYRILANHPEWAPEVIDRVGATDP